MLFFPRKVSMENADNVNVTRVHTSVRCDFGLKQCNKNDWEQMQKLKKKTKNNGEINISPIQ